MIKTILYLFSVLFIVSCNINTNDKIGLTESTTIVDSSIATPQKYDTNVRNIYLNSLKKFYKYVAEKDSINESFFEEILKKRITPMGFVKWNFYNKTLFEETIVLIFFKNG